MCGLVGFLNRNTDIDPLQLKRAASALRHRGPDREGIWFDATAGIGLGHCRLSILELSSAGDQPMVSHSGQYVLVYNGEVYNHLTLRENLKAEGAEPEWMGHSDTETLLAAISAWGLVKTLQRSRGMFALGLWNRKTKSLLLARDRVGEKPLYYGMAGSSFVFASELRAIPQICGDSLEVDHDSLSLMLRYGYVPSPRSIYRGIFKMPPGTLLHVQADGTFGEPEAWWSLEEVVQKAQGNRLSIKPDEVVQQLEALLSSAIREQMVADVPLGALLSGGVDSSLVVALMQAQSKKPVQTFTIGFQEKEFDESTHAKLVARHLGTHHTELHVTPKQALEIIPRLPEIYDEPFADASQVPTALVCEMTRRHVKVALSGDAGDELFGGYNRYIWTLALWAKLQHIPRFGRAGIASTITAIPASCFNRIQSTVGHFLPNSLRVNNPGDKLHKLAEVLGASSKETFYQKLASQWHGGIPLLRASEPSSYLSDSSRWLAAESFAEQMMAVDTLTYLPDDILVKLDRASMAVGLEMRVPFLDERIINFAWRLPLSMKIQGKTGKWILRQLLHRRVPAAFFERPKQGFSVPIDKWLRGPLRDWAEDLLSPSNLAADGLLDPRPIQTLWKRHLSGANVQYALWGVLMYQAWARSRHV